VPLPFKGVESMTLEELKLYCRVDGTEEDTLLAEIQESAEAYLSNAGILENYINPLYTRAVKLLAKHWYDNRELYVEFKATKISYSLDSIIFSLKYNQPVVIP